MECNFYVYRRGNVFRVTPALERCSFWMKTKSEGKTSGRVPWSIEYLINDSRIRIISNAFPFITPFFRVTYFLFTADEFAICVILFAIRDVQVSNKELQFISCI